MVRRVTQRAAGCLALVASLGIIPLALAGEAPAGDAAAQEPRVEDLVPTEFESFPLVFLRAGPKADALSEEEVSRIQMQHLAHLKRLTDEGKIAVAGPFSDQADPSLRGMVIYRVATVEEARALAEADPAVKAGRLTVDVVTWWTAKGAVRFREVQPAKGAASEGSAPAAK